MELEALKFIGIGLTIFGMASSAIAVSNIFSSMLNGIARNPEAEDKLKKHVYTGAALAEAMGLFSFVIALLLIFVV